MSTELTDRAGEIAIKAAQRIVQAVSSKRTTPLSEGEISLIKQKAFDDILKSVLLQLIRGERICAILEQGGASKFIGPMKQRGFYILVREEESERIEWIETVAGKRLNAGTIVSPCGFGERAPYLEAARQYQQILSAANIASELIKLPHDKIDAVPILFVPEQ